MTQVLSHVKMGDPEVPVRLGGLNGLWVIIGFIPALIIAWFVLLPIMVILDFLTAYTHHINVTMRPRKIINRYTGEIIYDPDEDKDVKQYGL